MLMMQTFNDSEHNNSRYFNLSPEEKMSFEFNKKENEKSEKLYKKVIEEVDRNYRKKTSR